MAHAAQHQAAEAPVAPIRTAMKWVKINKYCELSGDTPDAIYAKNRRKIWTEGVHYKKAADGCLWINLEEVDKWVEQDQSQSRRAA